jgi:hypothetical protein
MKRKGNTGAGAESRAQRARGKAHGAESNGHGAEGKEPGARSREQLAGSQQPVTNKQQQVPRNEQQVTRKNSTVYKVIKDSASSPSADGGKASRLERKGGQQVWLTPVTIEISREEAAITACGFLRFFNN